MCEYKDTNIVIDGEKLSDRYVLYVKFTHHYSSFVMCHVISWNIIDRLYGFDRLYGLYG
jgi:hypothetical protein